MQADLEVALGRLESPTWPRPNLWVSAQPLLAAFEHLRAPQGYQLVCLCEAVEDDRQSRLLWLRTGGELPEVPAELRSLEFEYSLGGPSSKRPPDLSSWVEWDVGALLLDSGEPAALFDRSIFSRWITQTLNFGHPVYWPRHRVLAAAAAFDDVLQEMPGIELHGRPSLEPTVTRFRATDEDPDQLPDHPAGQQELRGKERWLVRFYSHTAYVQETVTQHSDWYLGRRLAGSEMRTIATGTNSYLV